MKAYFDPHSAAGSQMNGGSKKRETDETTLQKDGFSFAASIFQLHKRAPGNRKHCRPGEGMAVVGIARRSLKRPPFALDIR